MIRKPAADWRREESAALKTVKKAAATATDRGVRAARSGGHLVRAVFFFFFAGLWGFAAIAGGLVGGSVPTFIGVGAMSAAMAWCGMRALGKAREA